VMRALGSRASLVPKDLREQAQLIASHQREIGALGKFDFAGMEPWTNFWRTWSSWSFLKGYLEAGGHASFIPKDDNELRILLDAFVMEKAIYELGYELNNRPEWLLIPLLSIGQLLGLESNKTQNLMLSKPGTHESPRA
jgi:hypothetical protein